MHVELMLENETDAQLALRFGNNKTMREAFEAARGWPLAVTYEAALASAPPKPAVKAAASRPALAKPAPTPTPAPARVPTSAEIQLAGKNARRRSVMASSHAVGRQAYANALLAEDSLNSDQIIAALAESPTDAERAAKARQAAADAVWDRVNRSKAR
jgi:hypothetical protein